MVIKVETKISESTDFDKPSVDRPHIIGGRQKIWRFENGFGASVVQFEGAYVRGSDEWELAVIRFDKNDDWELDFTTPITDDVLGYLKEKEVEMILKQIANLK